MSRQGVALTEAQKAEMIRLYPTMDHLPSERQKHIQIGRKVGCNFTTVKKHIEAWKKDQGVRMTRNQKEFIDALRGMISETGVFPTYRAIRERMGIASDNSITQYLHALESSGYLYRSSSGWKIAAGCCPACGSRLAEVAA